MEEQCTKPDDEEIFLEDYYDITVLGNGPAAALISRQLLRKGLSVLILSADGLNTRTKPGETLSPAAIPVLKRLGLLQELQNNNHLKCYGNQSAWGDSQLQDVDFIFSSGGHGWHLDRARFDSSLLQSAQTAGAKILYQVRIHNFQQSHHLWKLNVNQPDPCKNYTTRFLVDATGRSSWLLRKFGIQVNKYDHLLAFIGFLSSNSLDSDQDSRTLIEAVTSGWWYSALLPNKKRVVMYFTDKEDSTAKIACSIDGMKELLNKTHHVNNIVYSKGYELTQAPIGKPANSCRAGQFISDNWIAIGDAACSFDPLSSQGILFALESADFAAELIHERLSLNYENNQQYEQFINKKYNEYLENRYYYYNHEQRWLKSNFWSKMHRYTLEALDGELIF